MRSNRLAINLIQGPTGFAFVPMSPDVAPVVAALQDVPVPLMIGTVGLVLLLSSRWLYAPLAGIAAFAAGVPGGLFFAGLVMGFFDPSWATGILFVGGTVGGILGIAAWYRLERLLVFVAGLGVGYLVMTATNPTIGLLDVHGDQLLGALIGGVVLLVVHRFVRWWFATGVGAMLFVSSLAFLSGNAIGPFPEPDLLVTGTAIAFVVGVLFQALAGGRRKDRSTSRPTRSAGRPMTERAVEPLSTFEPVGPTRRVDGRGSFRIAR